MRTSSDYRTVRGGTPVEGKSLAAVPRASGGRLTDKPFAPPTMSLQGRCHCLKIRAGSLEDRLGHYRARTSAHVVLIGTINGKPL